MTSDAVQNYYIDTAEAAATDSETLELSRMQSFVDGDEDIFDVLAQKGFTLQNDEEIKTSMDTSVDLINATKNKLFMAQKMLLKGRY